jgi:hypothetical protein
MLDDFDLIFDNFESAIDRFTAACPRRRAMIEELNWL